MRRAGRNSVPNPVLILLGYWAARYWLLNQLRREQELDDRTKILRHNIRAVRDRLQAWEDWAAQDPPELQADPTPIIWCDGHPVEVGTEAGQILWENIKARSIAQGLYNSKNLEEGGWYELHLDHYRQQGHSTSRAEELLNEALELGHIPSLYCAPIPIKGGFT